MGKHTPGPWKVEWDPDGGSALEPAVMHDGYYVATCHEMSGDAKGSVEALENARLIAAAPDLLGALRSALLVLNGLTSEHQRSLPVIRDELERMAAAIAKAEGRS